MLELPILIAKPSQPAGEGIEATMNYAVIITLIKVILILILSSLFFSFQVSVQAEALLHEGIASQPIEFGIHTSSRLRKAGGRKESAFRSSEGPDLEASQHLSLSTVRNPYFE
jgi:hypothetical protein